MFIRILLINLLFFLLNVFFYDGKILIEFYFLKITDNGIENSIKKIALLFALFLFSTNLFFKNKNLFLDLFGKRYKNNLILSSIKYFFYFLEILNSTKITFKRFLFRILRSEKAIKSERKEILSDYNKINNFILYNIISIIVFLLLFVFYILNSQICIKK